MRASSVDIDLRVQCELENRNAVISVNLNDDVYNLQDFDDKNYSGTAVRRRMNSENGDSKRDSVKLVAGDTESIRKIKEKFKRVIEVLLCAASTRHQLCNKLNNYKNILCE